MDFCFAWLRKLVGSDAEGFNRKSTRDVDELTVNMTERRDLAHFTEGLARVYTAMARALKPGAPLAFTYHHNKLEAYHSIGVAVLDAGLTCSASLPCPAEMGGSIHIMGTGSSIIDTVFVCRSKGATKRRHLFGNMEELTRIVRDDLGQLRLAGVKPTMGDIRCITFGHLTRMAIWLLRTNWDARLPTVDKLEKFAETVNSIGPYQFVVDALTSQSENQLTQPAFREHRDDRDAVAFRRWLFDANLDLNPLIDEVFGELKSGFLELPKGRGFVDYAVFERGYQALKKATRDFAEINTEQLISCVYATPIAFIVLRTILGFTPSEWADITSERTDTIVNQGAARSIDRHIRIEPLSALKDRGSGTDARTKAMIISAARLIEEGPRDIDKSLILHRLDKVDTAQGLLSIRPIADLGVPYPILLYERFLGRPFAGHRDSVSELVGDVVESAIEDVLSKAGVRADSGRFHA
jgi:hypothetical protein